LYLIEGTKFTDSSADTKAYIAYDTKAKTYRHMEQHYSQNNGRPSKPIRLKFGISGIGDIFLL
jgi:hypothetical protein